MRVVVALLVLGAVLSIGCDSSAPPTPTPIPAPTSTQPPYVITGDLTVVAAQATYRAGPSATPYVFQTSTPVDTPAETETPTPSSTPTPTYTPLPTETQVPRPTLEDTPLPAATLEGVTVAAKTGSKSAPFHLAGGNYAIDYKLKDNTGSTIGCYVGYMDIVNIALADDLMKGHERFSSIGFMDTGDFAETSYVYNIAPGTYFVDTSISTCEWSVTIRRP